MNANSVCCNIKYKPNDKKYDQSIRKFQGCPTIAVTKGGRIYMGWYSGGTRFFVSRTPSGNVLLVVNDDEKSRKNLTALLSDDDGKTWKYKCLIDSRNDISYPDVDFYNGKIYLTYDRERTGCKEILFLTFTEQEIIDGKIKNPVTIVSKP